MIQQELHLGLIFDADDPAHVPCWPSMLLVSTLDGPAITGGSAFFHQSLNLLRAPGA